MDHSVAAAGSEFNQRERLLDALQRAIDARSDDGGKLALLLFNIRRFREINAWFGHRLGDRLLEQVNQRIREALRPRDRVFHVGNDEFAVLLTELPTPQVSELAVRKILAAIGANFEIDGRVLSIGARSGGALFPDHAGDLDELLRAADTAMYAARDAHCDYRIFDTSIVSQEQRLANLKGKLREALDNSDLLLHYQPQINLQRSEICGCEALVRWKHETLGWIRPDLFIPIAETSELIDTLTYWSVNVALREWFSHCGDCENAAVSVNLSARLLHSPEVVELIARAMNIWGATPAALVLEVTESAMMSDPEAALRTLSALHDMGIKLSIDDFGTGYSSLAYLQKLPVSGLKIDKSFVQHMADDPQDRKIVQSIIDLAHNLDMRVVAEGIENQQSLDMLVGMGCDYGQGYHIARPMPAADLRAWAEASPWRKPGVSR
jgi:diguanylate cyclase (GGDEF)-like protein